MDGDFDNVTDELVYVRHKYDKINPRFNPLIEVEKGKMLLVRSWTKDEGEMIWMEKTTSYIFQNDESETLHVKVDWWKLSSGKYILEQYWVPNFDDTWLGSILVNTIVWAWMKKKEDCRKTTINKCGVQVVIDLLDWI